MQPFATEQSLAVPLAVDQLPELHILYREAVKKR
jgi:hypothetical protein